MHKFFPNKYNQPISAKIKPTSIDHPHPKFPDYEKLHTLSSEELSNRKAAILKCRNELKTQMEITQDPDYRAALQDEDNKHDEYYSQLEFALDTRRTCWSYLSN